MAACLWCGKRLREVKEKRERPATPEEIADQQRRDEQARARAGRDAETAEPFQRNRRYARDRVFRGVCTDIVGTGTYGWHGEGLFCTMRCGYLYGRKAARRTYHGV